MHVLTQANESYIGVLLQGKEEKVSYKLKKVVKKPKEEWARVEGAHRAIVSKEDFALVQNLFKIHTRATRGEKKAHKYTGLLFCADCKERMVRRRVQCGKKEEVSFICSSHNQSKVCSRHPMTEIKLDNLIRSVLSIWIPLFVEKEKILLFIKEDNFCDEVTILKQGLKQIKEERKKYQILRAGLALDREKGRLTEEDASYFGEIYEKQCEELRRAEKGQEKLLAMLPAARDDVKLRQERLIQNFDCSELERRMLLSFINRILIYGNNRVSIEIRCTEKEPSFLSP